MQDETTHDAEAREAMKPEETANVAGQASQQDADAAPVQEAPTDQAQSKDANAGGIPPQSEEDLAKASDVEEFMRDVIDPELGINVVDLGLVYDIWIENGNEACVNMTLTSPACPLTDVLEDQAHSAVVGNNVVEKLTLNWVWMPPWGPHMITEDGREQLRALGFSV